MGEEDEAQYLSRMEQNITRAGKVLEMLKETGITAQDGFITLNLAVCMMAKRNELGVEITIELLRDLWDQISFKRSVE